MGQVAVVPLPDPPEQAEVNGLLGEQFITALDTINLSQVSGSLAFRSQGGVAIVHITRGEITGVEIIAQQKD